MADRKHLKFLKMGVAAWNLWRSRGWESPNLRRARLAKLKLCGADLSNTDLIGADLSGANLDEADLSGASLNEAVLKEATLIETDLRGADLGEANFVDANLSDAQLNEAILYRTNFTGASLNGADVSECRMGWTIIGDVDLRTTKGLSSVFHDGPSTIGLDTIYRSNGKISKAFLRGAGVSENFIADVKKIASKRFHSCFISYSSKDRLFAERLHADLQSKGVRCWYAPKDLPIGSETRSGIDQAIRSYDKLLVVLSRNSVRSSWVKKEVETAFDKESAKNPIVLFPIRLDDEIMDTRMAWAADIRRTRNIGDFRDWKILHSYKRALTRLLQDLRQK